MELVPVGFQLSLVARSELEGTVDVVLLDGEFPRTGHGFSFHEPLTVGDSVVVERRRTGTGQDATRSVGKGVGSAPYAGENIVADCKMGIDAASGRIHIQEKGV